MSTSTRSTKTRKESTAISPTLPECGVGVVGKGVGAVEEGERVVEPVGEGEWVRGWAVSYTHLTLPTRR